MGLYRLTAGLAGAGQHRLKWRRFSPAITGSQPVHVLEINADALPLLELQGHQRVVDLIDFRVGLPVDLSEGPAFLEVPGEQRGGNEAKEVLLVVLELRAGSSVRSSRTAAGSAADKSDYAMANIKRRRSTAQPAEPTANPVLARKLAVDGCGKPGVLLKNSIRASCRHLFKPVFVVQATENGLDPKDVSLGLLD